MIELKTKNCRVCGKKFSNRRKNGQSLGDSQFDKARFCSLKCFLQTGNLTHKNKKHSKEWKKNMSVRLKKEHAKGLRKNIFTPEVRKKMSESRLRGIKEGRIKFWNKGKKQSIEEKRKYSREWMKKKINNDPIFKLHCRLRARMNHYFRGHKPRRTTELLGIDLLSVKKYIESQFKDGMTWKNYGKWHVDHIVPLSSAKTFKEALSLWHYTNIQPLWAIENLRKSNKVGGLHVN